MITIKTEKEIAIMVEGGRILAEIMRQLEQMAEPGITTKELNRVAEDLVFKYGAEPAFKGYDGFPAALCASINSVIVHAVPSDYQLKPGDILSLDLGIKYKGFYTDMAMTVLVGRGLPSTKPVEGRPLQVSSGVDSDKMRLIRVAKKALRLAIKKTRPGNTIGDVGNTIQRYVEGQGFNVVRELCGHGIGKGIHEEPKILNYGKRHSGPKIKQGMVFCLEPMVTAGDWHLKKAPDKFGYETADGSLSAHFEHTVAVTKHGCRVLTKI